MGSGPCGMCLCSSSWQHQPWSAVLKVAQAARSCQASRLQQGDRPLQAKLEVCVRVPREHSINSKHFGWAQMLTDPTMSAAA